MLCIIWIYKISNGVNNTSFTDQKNEHQAWGSDASILVNNGNITLQNFGPNCCVRRAWARKLIGRCFSCSLPPSEKRRLCRRLHPIKLCTGICGYLSLIFFFLGNKELYRNTCFVARFIDRLHCEALLQCCCLSEIFTTSYINVGNFKSVSIWAINFWEHRRGDGLSWLMFS